MNATKLSNAELNEWIAVNVFEEKPRQPEHRMQQVSKNGGWFWSYGAWEPLIFTVVLEQAIEALKWAETRCVQKNKVNVFYRVLDEFTGNWLLHSENPAREICEAIYEAMKGEDNERQSDQTRPEKN